MTRTTKIRYRSSVVGMGCLMRKIDVLGRRMSTQILISSLFFFGVITRGLTHCVASSTFSIMSSSSSRFISVSTFFRMWKGIQRCAWMIGFTSTLCLDDWFYFWICMQFHFNVSGVAPGKFRRGADASDGGANYIGTRALKPDRCY